MKSALVFGGYGVFGSLVCEELARSGVRTTVAGRDEDQARSVATKLGPGHSWLRADTADPRTFQEAIGPETVAVVCAGPFRGLGGSILRACIESRADYVDISDTSAYALSVLRLDREIRSRNLRAVTGCSSLPGISGALSELARKEAPHRRPTRARITLLIGNRNPKGAASIASLVDGLGKPFRAPQGDLIAFRDPEVVDLGAPFGRRAVYNFESPDYEFLPKLLPLEAVSVKVGFELRSATRLFATMAALSDRWGPRTARALAAAGGVFSNWGRSGGAVMAELFDASGPIARARLVAEEGGQRMAALPCALVATALCRREVKATGAMTAYEALGSQELVDSLAARGYKLTAEGLSP